MVAGSHIGGDWPHAGTVLGIDVGGTKTLGVAMSGGIMRGTHEVRTGRGEKGVVDSISAVVGALRADPDTPRLRAVGVGVPGIVEADTGVVSHAVNLDLVRTPLGRMLAARLGVPVVVENDVNAAALGASRAADAPDSVAFLNLGTGLAGGVVLHGRIHRGRTGSVGEFGHIVVDPGGDWCRCGQRGCLELSLSGSAFRRMMDRAAVDDAHLFLERARTDEQLEPAVRAFFDRLAWTIQLIVVTVDVERVVIGGGITRARPAIAEWLAAALGRSAVSPFVASLDLGARTVVQDAGIPIGAIGAASLAVDALTDVSALAPAP